MGQRLSIFTWTPEKAEGFEEVSVTPSTFDEFHELNLSQEEGYQLINYIQDSLDNDGLITFRLVKGE